MIKDLILIFFLVILYSCSEKTNIPKGIIKLPQMEEVLFDMMKADALASEIVKQDSSLKLPAMNIELYKKVFSAHNITRTVFDSSYSFYEKHPEMMRILLDSMNVLRERKRANIYQSKLPKFDSSKI